MSRQMILLDMVGVIGSDLMVLPTALDAPLGAMFANRDRREGFALAPLGGAIPRRDDANGGGRYDQRRRYF